MFQNESDVFKLEQWVHQTGIIGWKRISKPILQGDGSIPSSNHNYIVAIYRVIVHTVLHTVTFTLNQSIIYALLLPRWKYIFKSCTQLLSKHVYSPCMYTCVVLVRFFVFENYGYLFNVRVGRFTLIWEMQLKVYIIYRFIIVSVVLANSVIMMYM